MMDDMRCSENACEDRMPMSLEAAHAEIKRLREQEAIREKREALMKYAEERADKLIKGEFVSLDNFDYLVDCQGTKQEVPKSGIVGIYFSMKPCPACKKFDAVLNDFTEANADAGFRLIYCCVDDEEGENYCPLYGSNITRIPYALLEGKFKMKQELKIVFYPTLIIVNLDENKLVTRFGREAIEFEKISGHTMAAWKQNHSGVFPRWMEKRRTLYFNPLSFLLWVITCYLVMFFVFGISAYDVFLYGMRTVGFAEESA